MTTMQAPVVDPAQADAEDRRLFPTLTPDEMDLVRREGASNTWPTARWRTGWVTPTSTSSQSSPAGWRS